MCSKEGISPDPSKYSSIKRYPTPDNADAVRRFVAMANYYRKFIKDFATIAKLLNQLTRNKINFIWSSQCQLAFDSIKKALIKSTKLAYPDFTSPFTLTVDASKNGVGAVLSQRDQPIAYASKSFNQAGSNKSTIEQELIAIHWSIKHFKPYLYGIHFTLKSDHKPLIYLFNLKDPTSKLTRLRLELSEYQFTIEHIKGTTNVVADALSRIDMKDIINNKNIMVTTRSETRKKQVNKIGDKTIDTVVHLPNFLDSYSTQDRTNIPLLTTYLIGNKLSIELSKNKKILSSFIHKNISISLIG